MAILRPYQQRTVDSTRAAWGEGSRAVCIVAPTGSGKTVMAASIVSEHGRVVWVAHLRELVTQAAEKLRDIGLHVGVICPGHKPDDTAQIQVGTIQTLLARDIRPQADLVVLDEAPHYSKAAEYWSTFTAAYADSRKLGLTATPQRADGSPLGDIFDRMIVAASYSELLRDGHIAPCVVYAPPATQARSGWSLDPVTAYEKYTPSTRAFVFFNRIPRAEEWERNFNVAGVMARTISQKTSADDRQSILDQFRTNRIKVICNVNTMTEGVDVPAAATCILARPCAHASTYLQMVGRVLRPYPGKEHATLLDLVDASSKHGYPTEDRNYSLDGQAITATRTDASGLRKCLRCSAMFSRVMSCCPQCGLVVVIAPPPQVHIWNMDLRRVYAGSNTPDEHKRNEYDRLRSVARGRGFSITWVIREYQKLFTDVPFLGDVDDDERQREYQDLVRVGREKGFKSGFAAARYKSIFGSWPPRSWAGLSQPQRPW
jgi:superfamily II DNA or RNA helicase